MESCSVCMNPTLSAPIHAATAMLTATVTAMSMIDATTGLSAFLLFLKFFIFSFIPPFGIDEYVRREYAFKSYDLIHHILYVYNKTTRRKQKVEKRQQKSVNELLKRQFIKELEKKFCYLIAELGLLVEFLQWIDALTLGQTQLFDLNHSRTEGPVA